MIQTKEDRHAFPRQAQESAEEAQEIGAEIAAAETSASGDQHVDYCALISGDPDQ
jgi:hypothetical protein